MTISLTLGVIFWILAIGFVVLWIVQRWVPGWDRILLFGMCLVLGIATFGGLHIGR